MITGHSLGAALATITALELAVANQVKAELWTFGSPRVGDATFVANYGYHSTVSWRVYNAPDVVPRVPFFPIDEYQHVTAGYMIDSIGKAKRTIACSHHLSTYQALLADNTSLIDRNCQP